MFLTIYDNSHLIKGTEDTVTNAGNKNNSSPRQYFALITMFLRIMSNYENSIKERQTSLEVNSLL